MVSSGKRFGQHLRVLREARRMTLEEVERRTLRDDEPVTRSLLSRLENGKARISALKLLSLSRLYGVRLGVLAERLEIEHALGAIALEPLDGVCADGLVERARAAGLAGDLRRALALYEVAERRAAGEGGGNSRARARRGVVEILVAGGRYRSARAALDELLSEPLPAAESAWAWYHLAIVTRELGQTLLSRAAHLSLQQVDRPWPPQVEACAPSLHAEALLEDGRLDAAFEAWLVALDAARRAGETARVGLNLVRIAETERRRRHLEAAQGWTRKALEHATANDLQQALAQAWIEQGRIHRARGRIDLAREDWAQARRLARRLDLHLELFNVYAELWRVAASERDLPEARAALRSLRHLARLLETLPRGTEDLSPHLEFGAEREPGANRAVELREQR